MRTTLPLLAFTVSAQLQAAEFTATDICKATISVEMSQPALAMRTDKVGDMPVISYTRKDDNQKFTYRYRIEGNRVVCSTFFPDEKQWGRWRNHPEDALTHDELMSGELKVDNDQIKAQTFKRGEMAR
ncbi:hypothetical protein SAMN05216588_113143 [Pseudomonas flavescens]|uniref:Uncharacterized protein n=1 Tax=Phytopseudomonas flavescens TaxID=29435 RepID=A0A1G8J1Q5_9GAMM|nr:hypothetical protein [Pseudomonas flavescens]SDI24897.1 hypothetical protein SAMN05216588_113143 [Pseudomonas flavescens]